MQFLKFVHHEIWLFSKWSEMAQSCLTLCDPLDYSPPGSSVHGIFLARILEWVAISFSRRSSWPRDWTQVSHIVGRCFTLWATREVKQQIKKIWFNMNKCITLPSSAGKESACNAGDLGSIPGFRRSPGEGKGYPLQYSGLVHRLRSLVHRVAISIQVNSMRNTCVYALEGTHLLFSSWAKWLQTSLLKNYLRILFKMYTFIL